MSDLKSLFKKNFIAPEKKCCCQMSITKVETSESSASKEESKLRKAQSTKETAK